MLNAKFFFFKKTLLEPPRYYPEENPDPFSDIIDYLYSNLVKFGHPSLEDQICTPVRFNSLGGEPRQINCG